MQQQLDARLRALTGWPFYGVAHCEEYALEGIHWATSSARVSGELIAWLLRLTNAQFWDLAAVVAGEAESGLAWDRFPRLLNSIYYGTLD